MKMFLELVKHNFNDKKKFYLFEIHAHVFDQSETKNPENVEQNFQKMRIFGFFCFYNFNISIGMWPITQKLWPGMPNDHNIYQNDFGDTVRGQKKPSKVNECSSVANYRTAMIFFLQSSQYS
jgi:hypothetical protein